MVSEAFAAAHRFAPGDSMAAVINGRWQRLRIVGIGLSPEFVYEVGPGQIFPDNARFGVVWMHRDALAPALDLEGSFNDLAITLAPGASEPGIDRSGRSPPRALRRHRQLRPRRPGLLRLPAR